jgi:ABC-type dipeptide/oligopeptide/nickel transport system permease component
VGSYLVRRGLRTALVLLVASIAVFFGLRLAAGDPTSSVLNAAVPPEVRAAYRAKIGLDKPILVQYGMYLSDLARGDLGQSLITGKSIQELLAFYGRNSLVLGVAATLLIYAIGLPLGALAAAKRNTVVDQAITGFSVAGMGMPNFWLALLLIYLFASRLHWLPSGGCCSGEQLILPAVVLAAEGMAVTIRMTRSSMLEQLGQDYVRTHRAKGLSENVVLYGRVFRNALIPIISIAGLRVGWIVGYTLIVETIFQWPGLGYLLVDATLRRDYPVAQFFSLLLVAIVIGANLLADVAYGMADPRIRHA